MDDSKFAQGTATFPRGSRFKAEPTGIILAGKGMCISKEARVLELLWFVACL